MNPTNLNELFNVFGTSLKTGKIKVACKLCFDEAYEALVREEEENVRNGVQNFARGEEFLKNLCSSLYFILKFFYIDIDEILRPLVWSSTDANSVVVSSASSTMITHLRDCTKQPNNIREQAREKKGSVKRKRDDGQDDTEGDSPVVNRYYSHHDSSNFAVPIPPPQFTAVASASSSSHRFEGSFPLNYWHPPSGPSTMNAVPSIHTSLVDRGPGTSISSSSRYDPYLPSRPPSTDPSHGPSFTGSYHNNPEFSSRSPSIVSSVRPMDSVSAVGSTYSPAIYPQGVVQRQVSKSRPGSRKRTSSNAAQPWSDEKKKRWERLLIHLTASANFPLMWVQNPVWHTILDEYLPQAPRIS